MREEFRETRVDGLLCFAKSALLVVLVEAEPDASRNSFANQRQFCAQRLPGLGASVEILIGPDQAK